MPMCSDMREQVRGRSRRRIGGAPLAREFASDGGLEQGATEEVETLARLRQRRLALSDLGEQGIDLLDDAALLGQRWQRELDRSHGSCVHPHQRSTDTRYIGGEILADPLS